MRKAVHLSCLLCHQSLSKVKCVILKMVKVYVIHFQSGVIPSVFPCPELVSVDPDLLAT